MESVVLPGMLIFLSRWFTKAEHSRANTFLILGNPITVLWMSVVSGYLVHAFGWRGMFVIEGAPPILWAFVWRRMVEDWLAEIRERPFHRCHWMALGGAISCRCGLMVISSSFSDRSGARKSFIWPYLLVGAIAFYGSYLLGGSNYWFSYTLLVIAGGVMYAPYGPFFAWIAELLPRNVAGGAIALINCCGALGSFVGSYVVGWLNGATGGRGASFLFMAAALLISAILTLALHGPARVTGPVVDASAH